MAHSEQIIGKLIQAKKFNKPSYAVIFVFAWDGTDDKSLERRMNARPAHFECARKLKSSNNFILGGAMLDDTGKMIGSAMVVQFETEEGLKE